MLCHGTSNKSPLGTAQNNPLNEPTSTACKALPKKALLLTTAESLPEHLHRASTDNRRDEGTLQSLSSPPAPPKPC